MWGPDLWGIQAIEIVAHPSSCITGAYAWQVLALARKMMDGRTKQDILDSSYH